jgi:hypothetical protein
VFVAFGGIANYVTAQESEWTSGIGKANVFVRVLRSLDCTKSNFL